MREFLLWLRAGLGLGCGFTIGIWLTVCLGDAIEATIRWLGDSDDDEGRPA